jgi:hypothetical protein
MGWQGQLRDFLQTVAPMSDRQLVEQASKQFRGMLIDIEQILEGLNEVRSTLRAAIDDAEKAIELTK